MPSLYLIKKKKKTSSLVFSLTEQNLIENFFRVHLSVLKVRIELRAHDQSISYLQLFPEAPFFGQHLFHVVQRSCLVP